MKEKNNLDKKYLELQLIKDKMRNLQEQFSNTELKLLELEQLENNLDEIKNIKQDREILINFGLGIFLKARLMKDDDVVMGVGSDIVVKKNTDSAKEIINGQTKELREIILKLEGELVKLNENYQEVQLELQDKIKNGK